MLRVFLPIMMLCTAAPAAAQFTLYSLEIETGAFARPAADVMLGTLTRVGQGEGRTLRAGDLPLDLPGGDYLLDRPNSSAETFTLSETLPDYGIEAIYAPGPYGLFHRDGNWQRTDGMALRPAADIAAVLRQRWPFYEAGHITPVQPPEVTAGDRATALDAVRARYATTTETLVAVMQDTDWKDLPNAAKRQVFALQDRDLRQLLDALIASGTAEDAVMLFTSSESFFAKGAGDLATQLVDAAVAIETRHNTLDRGMGAFLFKAQHSLNDPPPLSPQVTLALARQGYKPALVYLAQALPTQDLPAYWTDTDRLAAFRVVLRYDTPALRTLAWDTLVAQASDVVAQATGEARATGAAPLLIPTAAPETFLYLAGTGASAEQLSLPLLDMQSLMIVIAPALKEPDALLRLYLGAQRQFSHRNLTSMVCPMLAGRSADPALLDRMHSAFLDFAQRVDHIRPDWAARRIIADGLTHCLVSPGRLASLKGDAPDDMWTYPIPWRYAAGGLAALIDRAEDGAARHVSHHSVDHAPAGWIDAALSAPPTGSRASDAAAHYGAYRRLATTAFAYDPGPYQGAAMMRMFVQPLRGGAESDRKAFTFGVVRLFLDPAEDARPLQVGLGLDVTGTGGGLAGAIARDSELVAANIADGARPMIDKVTLRTDAGSLPLSYRQTIGKALHVYDLPGGPHSAANAIIDLHLSTKSFDGTPLHPFVISFPLWRSPMAFEQRLHEGRMRLTAAD